MNLEAPHKKARQIGFYILVFLILFVFIYTQLRDHGYIEPGTSLTLGNIKEKIGAIFAVLGKYLQR